MSINLISASLIQSAARKLIALDAEANANLSGFDDKVIQIKIEDLGLEYFFSFGEGKLSVSENNGEQPISAAIKGNLPAFLAALANEHRSDSIFKGELHFSGEIGTAKKFQEFVQLLKIDWQEPIAQLFGDPVGHTIATGLQKLGGWLSQAGNSTRQDVSEYLQEEIRVTPSDAEQQNFFEQVDHLRSKADRLAAKVNTLSQTMSNQEHKNPCSNSSTT